MQRWTFEPAADAPFKARHAVVGFAERSGVPAGRTGDVALAVTEAVTNAVLHAYPDAHPSGPIELSATVDARGLRIVVRDHGIGLTPRPDSPGLGLGLPLMARLADASEVRTAPAGGTEVALRFRLAAAVSAA